VTEVEAEDDESVDRFCTSHFGQNSSSSHCQKNVSPSYMKMNPYV